MAEAFKELISLESVRTTAKHLRRVDPSFPRDRFVRRASKGLADLELKARVQHVADALAESLPDSFAKACTTLEQSLAPARSDTDLGKLVPCAQGLAGWVVWPMTDFVARYGLQHPARALKALHAMTQRNTAEYAIRPFLIEHRDATMRMLAKWASDPSPHVRRLASEGSRPRLPWGVQLKHLVEDPTPMLSLLERLQDDASDYVRRSVANHLNDIAKDHPSIVAEWLERHLDGASDERRAMLRHASRTLIKKSDMRVLRAWGLAKPFRGEVAFAIKPQRVAVGGAATMEVELRSSAKSTQSLLIDYVMHHVKKGGATSAKTWKGWRLELAKGDVKSLAKRHSCKPVTTRRDYPGRHQVDLVINGKVVATDAFVLTV